MTKQEELRACARGEGCLGKSQDDEPVFILVARDMFAADAVRAWADRVEHKAAVTGALTPERKLKIADARGLADRMDTWRHEHTGKFPD
jgi:hypothetical protein